MKFKNPNKKQIKIQVINSCRFLIIKFYSLYTDFLISYRLVNNILKMIKNSFNFLPY